MWVLLGEGGPSGTKGFEHCARAQNGPTSHDGEVVVEVEPRLAPSRHAAKKRAPHVYSTVVLCFWWGSEAWTPSRHAYDTIGEEAARWIADKDRVAG